MVAFVKADRPSWREQWCLDHETTDHRLRHAVLLLLPNTGRQKCAGHTAAESLICFDFIRMPRAMPSAS